MFHAFPLILESFFVPPHTLVLICFSSSLPLFFSLSLSFGRLRRRSTCQVGDDDDDDDDDDARGTSMGRAIALQPLNPARESHGPPEV